MNDGKHNPYPSPQEAAALLNREESQQNAEQFQRLAGYAQEQAAMNEALSRGTPTAEYAPPVSYVERPAVRSDAAVFALACRHLGYDALASVDELADICLLILCNRETVLTALSTLAADPAMENRIASTRRESRTGHILLAGLILGACSSA